MIKNVNIFVTFLDEGMIDYFVLFKKSLDKTYGNDYKLLVGVASNLVNEINEINSFDNNIIVKDVESFLKYEFSKKSMLANITIFTYGRFFIEVFFDEEIGNDKFFYIDSDVLVINKIVIDEEDSNWAVSVNTDNNMINNDLLNSSLTYWTEIIKKQNNKDTNNDLVLNTILEKITKRNYFNAGFIYVGNKTLWYQLCRSILYDIKKLYKYYDDQTLLNFYNDGHVKLKQTSELNFKVKRDSDFDREKTQVLHFLGPTKKYMRPSFETWSLNIKD